MFSSDFEEKITNVVEIDDIDYEPMNLLIRYFYTHRMKLKDVQTALQVLLAAEKYDVPVVKKLCEKFVGANLNGENVLMCRQIAEMINSVQLLEKCDKYKSDRVSN
jgi:hypothetical protein